MAFSPSPDELPSQPPGGVGLGGAGWVAGLARGGWEEEAGGGRGVWGPIAGLRAGLGRIARDVGGGHVLL